MGRARGSPTAEALQPAPTPAPGGLSPGCCGPGPPPWWVCVQPGPVWASGWACTPAGYLVVMHSPGKDALRAPGTWLCMCPGETTLPPRWVASADPLQPCPASKPLWKLQPLTPLWYPKPQSILRVRSESPGHGKSGRGVRGGQPHDHPRVPGAVYDALTLLCTGRVVCVFCLAQTAKGSHWASRTAGRWKLDFLVLPAPLLRGCSRDS